MTKSIPTVFYLAMLPLRMYAPSAGYGLPYMMSIDRRTFIVKDRAGYNFLPEIAYLEDGIYDDTPVKTEK
jgi:hypothetical protein